MGDGKINKTIKNHILERARKELNSQQNRNRQDLLVFMKIWNEEEKDERNRQRVREIKRGRERERERKMKIEREKERKRRDCRKINRMAQNVL